MGTVTGRKAPQGFKMIPEGEHVLHVTNVKGMPRDNVTLVTMDMKNAEGLGFGGKYPQKYDLTSDGGWAAFYFLLKNGYGIDLSEGDSFDIEKLEDTYVTVEIVHKEGTKPRDDGSYPVFANIKATVGPGEPFESAEDSDDSEGGWE